MFDRNKDGVFQFNELSAMFTVLEIEFQQADLKKLIMLTDTNKDGKIDSQEFNELIYRPKRRNEELYDAEEALDASFD